MCRKIISILVIIILVVCFVLVWKILVKDRPYLKASAKDIEWWRDAKFGLFIHWGPVSLKGTEIGWSRGGERRGAPKEWGTGRIPVEIYDNLYKEFNPV